MGQEHQFWCSLICQLRSIPSTTLLLNVLGKMGVAGTAFDWFQSYLRNRTQVVAVKGEQSERRKLASGVPQGSVLGPILFTTYTQPLSAVIAKYGHKHYLYADDSQIYVAFRPKDAASGSTIIQHIENCVTEIKRWMTSHFLKLNEDKTEVLVISTPAMSRYIFRIVICLTNLGKPISTIRKIYGDKNWDE